MFVATEATFLHANLEAFYASVEQRDDPRLRGGPERCRLVVEGRIAHRRRSPLSALATAANRWLRVGTSPVAMELYEATIGRCRRCSEPNH
jgi:nucleotidyltransferase/DNA polymerase involved in DNA repair